MKNATLGMVSHKHKIHI